MRAEKELGEDTEYELLFSVAKFDLDYWLCHNFFVKREKKTWLGSRGSFSSSCKTKTVNNSCSYSRFSIYMSPCIERETSVFGGFSSVDKRQGDWQGQGSTVVSLVHSSPLHPTPCSSAGTVSGRATSNNKISLLHSLLALSKGLIQRIAASLYLHTNKREDVDS